MLATILAITGRVLGGDAGVDDGAYQTYRSSSYTFSDVQSDHRIVVKFARTIGDGSYIDRVSRTVGSMLKTGDLNTTILGTLFGVAALALVFAGFSLVRRRRREAAEEARAGRRM